jgi:hypothetical protein
VKRASRCAALWPAPRETAALLLLPRCHGQTTPWSSTLMVRAYSARLPPEPKGRNASKESELRKQLEAKNKAAKLAARKRKQAEAEAMQAQTKRSQVMRSAEKKGQLAAVIKAETPQPRRKTASELPQSSEEAKAARDASKLTKDLTALLQRTQKEIDEEAAAFQAKLKAKAKAEERRKREEIRKRVAEEAAAEQEMLKTRRQRLKAELAEKLARKEAFEKKKRELAAKERQKVLAAKEKEEKHVNQALSDWKHRKDEQFTKDLAARKAVQEIKETEKKNRLREAQKDWQKQQEVRLAAEAALAHRKANETATFHEKLREKVVQDAIIRAERTAEEEEREASKASKAAIYAAEAVAREAPLKALQEERAAKATAVAGTTVRLW